MGAPRVQHPAQSIRVCCQLQGLNCGVCFYPCADVIRLLKGRGLERHFSVGVVVCPPMHFTSGKSLPMARCQPESTCTAKASMRLPAFGMNGLQKMEKWCALARLLLCHRRNPS